MTKATAETRLAALTAADAAARAIPPVWPLASSVAVNPFLGQSGMTLAETGALLERVAGESVTMPRAWFADKIANGDITDADLEAALAASTAGSCPRPSMETLKATVQAPDVAAEPLKTVADLASYVSGIDWPGLIAERFGAWAASYCDEGQALWAAQKRKGAYAEWCNFASHDLTPEITGLTGFAARVSDLPLDAADAIAVLSERMAIPEAAQQSYFHQLLLSLGGWGQYARYTLWRAELTGGEDQMITDFLAIRLAFEDALFALYGGEIDVLWTEMRNAHAEPVVPSEALVANAIIQEAAERASQRRLASLLAGEGSADADADARPKLQMAFCIDVRSEVFRRALESVDPSIQTLGFAGFFGLATAHKSFASDVEELRLPVLLNPGVTSKAGSETDAKNDVSTRYAMRAKRAWGRFKLAAVSSFAFVEAMGPVYVSRLLRDGLGLNANKAPNDPLPCLETELDLTGLTDAAETILRAMSLTSNFARLVVVAGHGANVVNNPHASALHCGACGGYSGEVNARLLASLLNVPDVRTVLVDRGITIPEDTLFVAGLHDTTTDAITLYEADVVATNHSGDLGQARDWLAAAGKLSRTERALRLPRALDGDAVTGRSRNWAEVRPEWALAGCRAFIAAPRRRTAGKSLEGTSFLHDYDWKQDTSFSVLELIMTAPVVVASWISLQYYGSVVAPGTFGAGNKLLHNVVGGIGVVEGNGGVMRAGLPWQSVHDGENFVHDPLRLSVCIEAPREAMSSILEKHEGVRALFDNKWLHLFALDEDGQMAWRYAGGLEWEAIERSGEPVSDDQQVA